MRCKTKQREGSRPVDPRVSSHHDARKRVGRSALQKSELDEINDRRGLEISRQNSAYRHQNNEGRFRKRRRPSLSLSGRGWPDAGFFSQEREYFFHQRVGSNAMFLSQDRDGAVLDKLIGPSDPNDWRIDHLRMQMLHHRTSEAVVQNVIFDGADDFDAACKKFERAGIKRLDPARIDERHRNAFLFQFARGFFGYFKHVAQTKDRHVTSVLDHFGLSDLEKFGFSFDLRTSPRAARVTDGDRTSVVVRHRPEHIDKFIFIFRLHVHPIRNVAQITDIEQAMMRWAVVTT